MTDITNRTLTLEWGKVNHMITAESMPANPFAGEEPRWSFNNGDLPYGVEASGFSLKFKTILRSQIQEGNYSISIGNFSTSFQLETRGKQN